MLVVPKIDVKYILKRGTLLYSFGGFGLLNNLLYVVILSAAIDLVGPSTPKGVVLLADVAPSFLFKITAPFFFHVCPYSVRVGLVVGLSFVGMLMVALCAGLPLKLLGIVLASFSSGIGEVSFLQLTHFYNNNAVHAWSSGTGAAGLVGSFLYMAMTSWAQFSARTALVFFSFMPFFIIAIYLYVLPDPQHGYHSVSQQGSPSSGSTNNYDDYNRDESSVEATRLGPASTNSSDQYRSFGVGFPRSKIDKLKDLLVPFILPLMSVYTAEYVINQGISPTLLFPLLEMPMFRNYRDAYVMYGTLYQVGVFISRSSGSVVRIRNIWLLAALQIANVLLAILQSLFMINPSIYINFIFMLFEGLLGGSAYVNTYMSVMEAVPHSEREFAMGAVTMSDSSGIVVAAFISMWLEHQLCGYQVSHDRPWCLSN